MPFQSPNDGRVTDVVMVGHLAQALTFLHHAHGLAPLVRSQLRLGSEFDASFLGGCPATIGTRQNTSALVLSQG
jgi:hypothetical protein